MAWLKSTVGLIVTGLALLLLIVGILWLQSCAASRQQAAQSRVDRGQSGAFQNSAADAVNTIGEVSSNDTATADLGRRNREEIKNAEGSQVRVNDAATAAGRNSLCRRAAYRNRPECRVQ